MHCIIVVPSESLYHLGVLVDVIFVHDTFLMKIGKYGIMICKEEKAIYNWRDRQRDWNWVKVSIGKTRQHLTEEIDEGLEIEWW